MLADFNVSTALPLILFLELEACLSPGQLAACLASLESFIARRVFAGEENKAYNKLFVDVIGDLIARKGAQAAQRRRNDPAVARRLKACREGHKPAVNATSSCTPSKTSPYQIVS